LAMTIQPFSHIIPMLRRTNANQRGHSGTIKRLTERGKKLHHRLAAQSRKP
jgi:hypothetical protein